MENYEAFSQLKNEELSYLRDRVDDQYCYYDGKAAKLKKLAQFLQIAILVCGALIPLSVKLAETWPIASYLTIGLGVLVTIFQGVSTVGKHSELAKLFRGTAEKLKREQYLFLHDIGEDGKAPYDFKIFVAKCEQIMSNENNRWQETAPASLPTAASNA